MTYVACITGASSGIGEATARRLAREPDVELVLVARRADRLNALAAELGGATVIAADLTDPDVPGRVRDTIEREHGGALHMLVNNAGARWHGTFADGGWADVERHMRLNFEAPVRLTEALLPLLRATAAKEAAAHAAAHAHDEHADHEHAGHDHDHAHDDHDHAHDDHDHAHDDHDHAHDDHDHGHDDHEHAGHGHGHGDHAGHEHRLVCIVNVASTAARVGRPGAGAYSASKFALAGWSDSLHAEERADGVHVGLVLPGFVQTEGFPATELVSHPLKRHLVAQPEAVAEAILEAGPGGRAERYVPRFYAVPAVLRSLAPALIRRATAGGAFTTAPNPSDG